ncbi:AGE family epimerase/isomerase [Marinifilum sp. RC60d5]|uniref:AGE family epimerase/isomerase n=1 Tax=Marinifilum sp. RC60d5 TaxID=3458414 RepID=UPI0040356977
MRGKEKVDFTSEGYAGLDLLTIKSEMSAELTNLLDFWSTEAIDLENGGFISRIDHFGVKNIQSPKGAVLNARILWTFSAAYRVTKKQKYKENADRAYHYLTEYFWDHDFGGLVWSVDNSGTILNSRKQAYAQGFGIYAFSEYYRISKDSQSLDYAKKLYSILEDKFLDKKNGGYIEALQRDWTSQKDMRLSEKDANSPKSMNTHLHILEPYTNLLKVWPDLKLEQSIRHLLTIFQNQIIDPNTGHFNLFFDMEWKVESSIISFGHDIEGAWLLNEAAIELKDRLLIEEIQKLSLKLVDISLNEGTDMDGSLFYEKEENHLDTDKHWWPQAEAMVGMIDAWEVDTNPNYLIGLNRTWEFIKKHLIDKTNGEWFWRVDQNGEPNTSDDKLGFWKCSYHNTRALMEVIERIDKIS